MAEASIPVDLFNPGQVFACMGFLEAADVLLGDAEGGFDWSNDAGVRFLLRAAGDENPFGVVLEFLAKAEIFRFAPVGYDHDVGSLASRDLRLSKSFPSREGDRMALPIRLESVEGHAAEFGHWADGSRRNSFKLYSGNRSADSIARAMLCGTPKAPGISTLWDRGREVLLANPFDVLVPMGGSFNFDARGGWTSLDAGYSPNTQDHGTAASPVVEVLAAWGLEHSRPDEYARRLVRYGVWCRFLPPLLARPALAGVDVGAPIRRFRFVLDLSGKNKVVTFAQEETAT